jgi:hypothetical protein
MGRYTSEQTISDFATTKVAAAALGRQAETSSSSGQGRTGPPPTATDAEVSTEVRSSIAGANSAQFHLYLSAKARETQRIKGLEQAEKDQAEKEEFKTKVVQNKQQAEERTRKNADKRIKKKRKREQFKIAKKAMKVEPEPEEISSGPVLDEGAPSRATKELDTKKDEK